MHLHDIQTNAIRKPPPSLFKGGAGGGCPQIENLPEPSIYDRKTVILQKIKTLRHPNLIPFIFLTLFLLVCSCSMVAQSWDFIKEKDGIKIYTRKDAGSSVK